MFVYPWELEPTLLQIYDKFVLTMVNPPWEVTGKTFLYETFRSTITWLVNVILTNAVECYNTFLIVGPRCINFDFYALPYKYDNSYAAGNMLYPEGLLKYYDLYSIWGQIFYWWEYSIYFWETILWCPFFGYPLHMYVGLIFSNINLQTWKVILYPFPYMMFSWAVFPSLFCTTLEPLFQISPQLVLIPYVSNILDWGCFIIASKEPWLIRLFGVELDNGFPML